MVIRLNRFLPAAVPLPAAAFILSIVVLLSISISAFPQLASAQEQVGGNIRVVMEGSTEATLAAAAKDAFSLQGWTTSIELQPTKQLYDCIKLRKNGQGCLPRLLAGADYVATFQINVDKPTGSAVVTASLLQVANGQSVVIPVQIFCQCKVEQTNKLASVIKKASKALIAELQSEESPSYVTIRCEPSDAVLTVDGIRIGSGKSKVASGQVTVVARREGYKSQRLTVPLSPGEELDLPIVLDPIKHSPIYWTGGIGLAVVGASAVGTGILFLDSKSSVVGDQRHPTSSRVRKVAVITVGGLLASAGLIAMALDYHRVATERRKSRSSVAMITPTENGFSIAVSGSF